MSMKIYLPFRTRFTVLTPSFERVNGVQKRTLTETGRVYCSARSFGGTEKVVDGVYTIYKTMVLQTYYRPDIVSGTVLKDTNGDLWEILGDPENIDMANRYLQIKVKRWEGDK